MRIIVIIYDLLPLYISIRYVSSTCVQERLARLLQRADRDRGEGKFPATRCGSAARDSIEGLLRGEHAAAIDQKAYLYRAAQNHLISEIRRQSRHEALPLHELSNDEHPLQHDPDAALRTAEQDRRLYSGRNRAQITIDAQFGRKVYEAGIAASSGKITCTVFTHVVRMQQSSQSIRRYWIAVFHPLPYSDFQSSRISSGFFRSPRFFCNRFVPVRHSRSFPRGNVAWMRFVPHRIRAI